MLNMFYAIGETQLTSTYNFSTLLGVVSCWVAVLGPDLRSSTVASFVEAVHSRAAFGGQGVPRAFWSFWYFGDSYG